MTAPFSGNKAYTSNDGGATNGYNIASISVNYFWRDVTIPAGQSILTYSFTWVCNGEGGSIWDLIQLFAAPTTVTPTATTTYPGSGLATTNLVGATFINGYQLLSTPQTASGSFSATPGSTIRVIFCWKNDGSGGTLPAGSLDNISLVSNAPANFAATATGGLWSSPATWVGGVVPGAGNNIIIPAGSIVTVDQVTSYSNLDINGIVQWNATANAMTLGGNLTVNAGGSLLDYTTGQVAVPINIAGNYTNNGYANHAVTAASGFILNFNGSGSTLSGTGTFEGDGTNGIIR
jgi:hypothetical protein